MNTHIRYILLCCLIVSVYLTGCQLSETDNPDNKKTHSEDMSHASETAVPNEPSQFSDDAQALCNSYFKGGDYNWQLTITPAEPDRPGQLYIYVEDSDSTFQFFSMEYDENTNIWPLKMHGNGNFPDADYSIEQKDNNSILLICDDQEQVIYDSYYPKDMLTMPDAFSRPLNQTDLLTLNKEKMGILRNEFFAAYGRVFTNETYQDYFLNQLWYVPMVAPENSSDQVFSRLIKRNIAFLAEAEASFDDTAYQETLTAYAELAQAPYYSLLQDGEVSIHIDSTSAEDMGLYYKANGSIGVPVTITEEEYCSLEQGRNLELCVNELTGRTITITRSDETAFSDYDEGNPYIIIDEGNYLDIVNFNYRPYEKNYSLWIASDDTIFNTIYEGDIYVLKGASTEYYYNFEYYEIPLTEHSAIYQVMDFDEKPSGFGMDSYYGNYPIFDEKGYLKALYFYGD